MLNRIYINTILTALLILFIFAGCGSKKQVSQVETEVLKPSWVNKKPIDGAYYYGVGKADKKYHASDYQQSAKTFALEDLSSEIEVKLDAQSVLYQKETSRNYFESYQAITQIEVSQNISGFEPVDSWNNENEYWVLYRLSKTKYALIEDEKRNKAIAQAIHYIDEAELSLSYKKRFDNLTMAMESIKAYLNKPLKTTFNNATIYLGNYISNKMEESLEGLVMYASKDEINLNLENCYTSSVDWSLQYKNIPVGNLPVRIKFKTFSAQLTYSDENGIFGYEVANRYFDKNQPDVEVWVNTSDLIDDPLIQSLFNQKYAFNQIDVSLHKPVFLVDTDEGKEIIQQEIIKAGGKVTTRVEQAGIILKFEFKVTELGKASDFYTSKCAIIVSAIDEHDNLELQKSWPAVKGIHLNRVSSRDRAIGNSLEQINYKWFQQLISDLCNQ